jgi:ABC-type phosphate transport system substrate-binding protein
MPDYLSILKNEFQSSLNLKPPHQGISMKLLHSSLKIQSLLFVIGLFFFSSAQAELVIVVNPQNDTKTLSIGQIAQYYLGTSVTFTPVEQANNSAIRIEFYKKVLDKEPQQVQALWARIIFTGKGKPPKEYKNSAEVKKAIQENVNAIGYIEKSEVDSTVKVIATVP